MNYDTTTIYFCPQVFIAVALYDYRIWVETYNYEHTHDTDVEKPKTMPVRSYIC